MKFTKKRIKGDFFLGWHQTRRGGHLLKPKSRGIITFLWKSKRIFHSRRQGLGEEIVMIWFSSLPSREKFSIFPSKISEFWLNIRKYRRPVHTYARKSSAAELTNLTGQHEEWWPLGSWVTLSRKGHNRIIFQNSLIPPFLESSSMTNHDLALALLRNQVTIEKCIIICVIVMVQF